jgi:hypothetical protein
MDAFSNRLGAAMRRLVPMKTLDLVELDGIEPTTSGLQSPRSPS